MHHFKIINQVLKSTRKFYASAAAGSQSYKFKYLKINWRVDYLKSCIFQLESSHEQVENGHEVNVHDKQMCPKHKTIIYSNILFQNHKLLKNIFVILRLEVKLQQKIHIEGDEWSHIARLIYFYRKFPFHCLQADHHPFPPSLNSSLWSSSLICGGKFWVWAGESTKK